MRNILQITGRLNSLVALCDDGTVWSYAPELNSWWQLPAVPGQPDGAQPVEDAVTRDRVALERQERLQQVRRDRFEGRS
ncbi:MAG: hypothetical protein M3R65_07995 [Gemmatimonadota bacterium]|nr:hypothetical protein [Gemmatimonadota bacterium]